MSREAWLYWAVILTAAVGVGIPVAATHSTNHPWSRFVVLTAVACGAQLFAFHLNRKRVFQPAPLFVVAGALLLPPELMLLLVVAQCIPDQLKQRYPWYIETFNIANYALGGTAAWVVAKEIGFAHVGWHEALAGAAAAITFFAVNRVLLAPMLRLGRGLSLRETGLLDLEDAFLDLVLAVTAVTFAALWDARTWLTPLALAAPAVIYITQRMILKVEEANEEIEERTREALEALARTVDAKDKYTAGHSRRVSESATKIATALGLEGDELEMVRQAALFHDIGKISMPDSVLLKEGPLSDSDWMVMRRHPEEGARIIEPFRSLADVVPAIRHHHERPDGRGYPAGLIGDEIPLAARIIHVADSLDAMTTDRPYRAALSLEVAMDELRRGRGTDFDAACVDALERANQTARFEERARSSGAAA